MQPPIHDLYKSFGSVEGILVDTGIESHSAFSLNDVSTLAVRDLLTDHETRCYFPGYLSEDVQRAIGKRASMFGLIFSNEAGERLWINAESLEVFPSEEDLPQLEDVIGILD